MARFEAKSTGLGVLQNLTGDVVAGRSFALSGGPLYAAETGDTVLSGGALVYGSVAPNVGKLPGWFDPDTDPGIYAITVDGVSVKFTVGEPGLRAAKDDRRSVVTDRSSGFCLRLDAAGGAVTSKTITAHIVTSDASDLDVLYGNWGLAADGVNAITVSGQIRYGGGTYPVYFDGATSKAIQPGATFAAQCPGVKVRKGEVLYADTLVVVGAGGVFPGNLLIGQRYGEGVAFGAALTLADAATATNHGYSPVAITGVNTSRPVAVGIAGDSIASGRDDGATNAAGGDSGWLWRALAGRIGYLNIAVTGETVPSFGGAGGRHRKNLLRFCSRAVFTHATNDLVGGNPAPRIEADNLANWKQAVEYGAIPVAVTVLPMTDSTDSWATQGNQTVRASEAERLAYNAWLRDEAPINANATAPVPTGTVTALRAGDTAHPLSAIWDPAVLIEQTGGKWPTDGAANTYTTDGTHPKAPAHALMAPAVDISTWVPDVTTVDADTLSTRVSDYRAETIAQANASPVATWPDSSPAGHDATLAFGAFRPTYRTSSTNGLPAVRFTPGSFNVLGFTATPALSDFTLLAVLTMAADGTLLGYGGGTRRLYFAGNAVTLYDGVGSAQSSDKFVTPQGSPFLLTVKRENGSISYFENGGPRGRAYIETTFLFDAIGANDITSNSGNMSSDLSRLLIVSHALTIADQKGAERDLATQFALTRYA